MTLLPHLAYLCTAMFPPAPARTRARAAGTLSAKPRINPRTPMDVSSLIAGRKARWLVTGAAGFIGSHLAESLALAGQSVIAIDDFSTGKQANIDAIMASTRAAGQNGLQFEEGTICDRAF